MSVQKVWINGKLHDSGKASISVFDRGFLYGDGIFETMRSYAGIVFKLGEHLERLGNAIKVLEIKPLYSARKLKEAVYMTLKANSLKAAYIRITMTRGDGPAGLHYDKFMMPNVVIMAREFDGYPLSFYRKGITAKMSSARQNDFSPVARLKSLNFLNYIIARQDALSDGFDEAILPDCAGYIAETSVGNLFIVNNETLATPSLSGPILPGITRQVILNIAKSLKLRMKEKKITPKEMVASDEVFMTNSLAEIVPIVKIGPNRIASGLPGEVTKLLHISYQKEVIRSVVI